MLRSDIVTRHQDHDWRHGGDDRRGGPPPGRRQANQDYVGQIGVPAETLARRVAFAINEPEDVGINEILFRPTVQELGRPRNTRRAPPPGRSDRDLPSTRWPRGVGSLDLRQSAQAATGVTPSRRSWLIVMGSLMTQVSARASAEKTFAQVRFFGKIADRFGRAAMLEIPAAGCSLPCLKARLADQFDGADEALAEPGLRVAVDHLIVSDRAWVRSGQEVAFLSMFSGG